MASMQPRAVTYRIKAAGWEFAALATAYVVVFMAAALFIFLIFRDAHLIGKYQPGIDAQMYSEAHSYILLIEIVLWTIMAKAAVHFKAYTRRIRHSVDGAALNSIANAMLLSFVYAILFDMASSLKTLFIRTSSLPLITTVTNLLPLAIFLVLSVLLFIGSVRLKRLQPDDATQQRRTRWLIALPLGVFLLLLVPFAQYFYREARIMLDDDGLHHFTLSPAVLLFVYLLPFAVIWLLGLLSCINLAQYASRIRGKLYKPLFRSLYAGILTAYISTYLIQIFYVSNLPSNQPGLGLFVVVSLIAMLIVGYGLMYRGADRLYMLERGPTR